jgi:hypothetical protein
MVKEKKSIIEIVKDEEKTEAKTETKTEEKASLIEHEHSSSSSDKSEEELPVVHMQRYPLDNVEHCFFALMDLFHPEGFDEDEDIDPRFHSLWTLTLTCSGWTEDEYWEAINERDEMEAECPKCKSEREEEEKKAAKTSCN